MCVCVHVCKSVALNSRGGTHVIIWTAEGLVTVWHQPMNDTVSTILFAWLQHMVKWLAIHRIQRTETRRLKRKIKKQISVWKLRNENWKTVSGSACVSQNVKCEWIWGTFTYFWWGIKHPVCLWHLSTVLMSFQSSVSSWEIAKS